MSVKTLVASLTISGLAQAAVASPFDVPLENRDAGACKRVSDTAETWFRDNNVVPRTFDVGTPEGIYLSWMTPAVPAVPMEPSLAFACLKSIPLNKTAATAHLEWLRPFFEWQSTLDYLKDPPRGYLSEAVDLVGALDEMAQKLETSAYSNHFEWMSDILVLGRYRARDGHFHFTPVLLDLFTFEFGAKFVSVSKDGLSPPQVFLRDDVKHSRDRYKASPVKSVDGVPVAEFLGQRSLRTPGTQDPDARYNMMFESIAKDVNAAYYAAAPDLLSLQDTTKISLENGTTLQVTNVAHLRANFTGITSPADVYSRYGVPLVPTQDPRAGMILPWQSYVDLERNYTKDFSPLPPPIDRTVDGSTGGYLPADRDFAVLAITAFSQGANPNLTHASMDKPARRAIIVDTITAAKAQNRTKLIIDLQANGGGESTNLATLYDILFPSSANTSLPLLWQHRVHDQLTWALEAAERDDPLSASPYEEERYLQPNGQPWPNLTSRLGPVAAPDDDQGLYTRPSVWNKTFTIQHPVFGYPDYVRPWETNPYEPDDIVILLDGECASSCAIFTASLVHGHGVRTVAVGGRPMEMPMQGVGQVKGGAIHSFPLHTINYEIMPDHIRAKFSPEGPTPVRTDQIIVNEANMYPVGGRPVPLQFVYEAANCKLFYKWEDLTKIQGLWDRVAEVTWGKGKCVKGSTTERNDRMGGVPGYRKEVEDRFKLDPKWPGGVRR